MYKKLLSPALLLILAGSIVFLSCKKDLDDNNVPDPGNPFAIPAATPVTGSITGMVVDENNNPVNAAIVSYNSTVVSTDARGLFSINNTTLDKYITTVTVSSPGYFKAFRSFSANATRNFVNIKLVKKALSGTVSSTTAGTVSLANGTVISLQANSFVIKGSGAAYNGTVHVFASYIDPTAADISAQVPGSFMGRDANNLYSLQSTGMIAVDLESPAGVALQLAGGFTANIDLPVPPSLLSKAPASIDTWSLNDQGIWQKEGTAARVGDHYQMQVTHFSFWNCDVPANAIYLTLHVQDQAGNALPNMLVMLTIPNNTTWWATTYGITDSLGNVSGLVPSGQVLTFNAYPNIYNCNNPVNTQDIGPFNANTSLTVTVTLATAQVLSISGTATNCSNQPLQSGTAIIHADMYGFTYTTVTNGVYSANIVHCSAVGAVSVTVIDNSNGVQAGSGSVAVSSNTVTVPVINVCGSAPAAVFTFGGGQGNCNVQSNNGTYTAGVALSGSNIIGISVNVSSPGSYSISTTATNGISFTGSGVFTATGLQTVFLSGSGTPLSGGSYTFQAMSGAVTGCMFIIFVNSPPQPQAVYDMGGPSACGSTTIAGSYIAGIPTSFSNTVSFNINVISTGTYSISTGNPINGMQFTDSGFFATTGPRVVLLHAAGIPINPGPATYTPMASNGNVGCTFVVSSTGGSNAVFTLGGSPGSCSGAVLSGSYTTGVALNTGNSISLTVNVTTPGAFVIQSNTANGITFAVNSTFTFTGVQTVTLQGIGTPATPGVSTYFATNGSGSTCSFVVQAN